MTVLAAPEAAAAAHRAQQAPLLPCRFLGVGTALPDRTETNVDLEARLDTSDAWIRERTGIAARRVAGPGDSTAALATAAGDRALAAAGLTADQVDLVVLATSTPDQACPATAAHVARALGATCSAFDLNGACTGFAHALHVGAALLADPALAHVLVIGADRFTSLVDPEDRSTAILFGDGAGAVVLGRDGEPDRPGAPGVLGTDLGGDPDALAVLHVPAGRSTIAMDGPELFRRATRALVGSGTAALGRAGLTPADVDLYVPHQANARIITAAAHRLGIREEATVVALAEVGNTSAASIPLALGDAGAAGRLPDGAVVLLSGVGAGLAWSSLVVRWGR